MSDASFERWRSRLNTLERVSFDSNALIYFLEGHEPFASYVGEILERLDRRLMTAKLASVVELELLVKPQREGDQRAVEQVELLLALTPNLTVRDLDRGLAQLAASVRARTGLAVPDAVIAATAIEDRCDALVGNDVVFARRFNDVPYLLLSEYER